MENAKKIHFPFIFPRGKYGFLDCTSKMQFNALFKSKIGEDFILKNYKHILKFQNILFSPNFRNFSKFSKTILHFFNILKNFKKNQKCFKNMFLKILFSAIKEYFQPDFFLPLCIWGWLFEILHEGGRRNQNHSALPVCIRDTCKRPEIEVLVEILILKKHLDQKYLFFVEKSLF